MTTSITAFPVLSSTGKRGGKPTSAMGVYGFATPRGTVYLGFYQNFEASVDGQCTSGQRRLLSGAEALVYATEGTLPSEFEARPLIGGGFGKDSAKEDLKARTTILCKAVAPKEVAVQALVKPQFDEELFRQFLAFKAMMDAQK